ncbi:trehalose-phosphatase [Aquibaculum arenosum]|uniref:Trehalose 6-phosphate phosphatase n=1 Tax=Aquibaculum arenosum TaxID=3032591 RepID=A0ABT5YM05_9PROT|nr:trehalose-phosphatase [Fodinicurvata sp. CAU 1616]MDF2095894.1 trehalose-phosphatase [Fodinicurvata sp. CAU 1616]
MPLEEPLFHLPAPPLPGTDWALFLDVDGCLLDIAERPDEVAVEAGLTETLACLRTRLGGALALVSGRPLAQLDALFAPLHLAAAGQHGLERRDARGHLLPTATLPDGFAAVEARLALFAERHPGMLLERKSHGLALHYRGAPACETEARRLAEALAGTCEPPLAAVPGKAVIELRVPGSDKGQAIAAFLDEPPFRGRIPAFAGDDVTDEDGFRRVNALQGHTILVGRRASAARWALPDPPALRRWLSEAAQALTPKGD